MPAGTITSLRAQLNDSERVNVFIDGAFALGVSLTTISRAGLYVGKQISADEYAQLEQVESGDKAFQAALRFIEARPRSSAEIRSRLERKEFAPEAITSALERLSRLGLIDDAAFARLWVEHRQNSRPRSTSALRDELRRKGIDTDVVTAILNDQALIGDAAEQAMAVARGALHKYRDAADRNAFTRRMGGYLQRRGFGFEIIRPIIDQLWVEIHHTANHEEEQ
jgi:regulatory protein